MLTTFKLNGLKNVRFRSQRYSFMFTISHMNDSEENKKKKQCEQNI